MSNESTQTSGIKGLETVDTCVHVRVPAKVNLTLRVGERADDGYHPVSTVFQAVSLYDELVAKRLSVPDITVHTRGHQAALVADDDTNLAVRAAKLLRDRFGSPELGVAMTVDKKIPLAGGMAGGSADAAGALLACSVLWDLDTSPDDLADLAGELGADVPFSLLGGTALGWGHGDKLKPVLTRGTYHWVLAFSSQGLSTPAVYSRFDHMLETGQSVAMVDEQTIPRELLNALALGDDNAVASLLVNDLGEAACQLRPELRETLSVGVAAGALAGIVSGSGPTCAFLCENQAVARTVAVAMCGLVQVSGSCNVTSPVPGAQLITG